MSSGETHSKPTRPWVRILDNHGMTLGFGKLIGIVPTYAVDIKGKTFYVSDPETVPPDDNPNLNDGQIVLIPDTPKIQMMNGLIVYGTTVNWRIAHGIQN